jgi:hypothetical protein
LNEDGGSCRTASSIFSEEQLTNSGEYSQFLASFLGYVTVNQELPVASLAIEADRENEYLAARWWKLIANKFDGSNPSKCRARIRKQSA